MNDSGRARHAFSIPVLAIALLGIFVLTGANITGCNPGAQQGSSSSASIAAAKKIKVNTPYTATSASQPGGTFTPIDNQTVQVTDAPFSGTLAATLPKKIKIQTGRKAFKLKRLSGSFYASIDGTTRANGSGNWTGTQLIRSNRRKLGFVCVKFTSISNNRSESGTFRVAGGTKAMKRTRFAGTFTQESDPQGNVTGQITGKVKLNKKKKGLKGECRALKPLVP